MKEERSLGAFFVALLALALLYGAYSEPWFHYEHSSGRMTAPDGPYEDPAIERETWTLNATSSHGDVEPSDPALVEKFHTWIEYAMLGAAGLLAIVILGEIPFIARVIRRPFSLALISIVLVGVVAMITLSWLWIPAMMEGYGVTEHYTAFLDEPDGYTTTTLDIGAYIFAFLAPTLFALALFKYQAGDVDPGVVEELAQSRAHRATE